jgi:hypothetical protein
VCRKTLVAQRYRSQSLGGGDQQCLASVDRESLGGGDRDLKESAIAYFSKLPKQQLSVQR